MRWKVGTMVWLAGVLACVGLALSAVGAAAGSSAAEPGEASAIEPFDGLGGPMATGPDGGLWLTDGKALAHVDAAGKLSEVPLSAEIEGRVRDIAAAPGGALWVTSKDEVDRITTAGAVTKFPLPKQDGEAGSIAVAADGTVWVTAWARRRDHGPAHGKAYVVRVRHGGGMTSFKLPGPASARRQPPESIVAGPDGNIWVTDPSFGRVGRFTPSGKLTEFHNRLRPEALAPDAAGGLWFVGTYGVGTITARGKITELRAGSFYELGIGGGYDAVGGPEGDLWFIGGATRVMRLTPTGHLDVLRGPGAPAAAHIAPGPGGAIWVDTIADSGKGTFEAPLLRYQPGTPGIEVKSAIAQVKGGAVRVPLSCGGSTSTCRGRATISFGRETQASAAYEVAAESDGTAEIALTAAERHSLAKSGFLRVSASATVDGGWGGFTQLVLRAPKLPASRPGHPVLVPLPEDIGFDNGWVRAPDGTVWAGGDVGRFTKISPTGHVSTVLVDGLSAEPSPIGFDAKGNLWFTEYHYEDALSVLGRLSPDGKLTQVHLPAGPPPTYEEEIGPRGELWIPRSDYTHAAELDKIAANGKVHRFPIGTEPGSLTVDGHGGIWFTEAGPKIVHLTHAGKRHVFPIPNKGSIESIALDHQGNVWFTHWSRPHLPYAIGRLSPDGSVVEYSVRHVGEVYGVAVEKNGDISFGTEYPSGEGLMTPKGKLIYLRRHHHVRGSHARTVALGGGG
jgi:virginiamycin B lyase